jgi:hypothetical protein
MRDNVLDASLSYASKGITIASKISTDRPGSDPAGRPLSSVESSLCPRAPWSLHRVPEFRVQCSLHRFPEFRGAFIVSPSSVFSVVFTVSPSSVD